MNFVRVEGFPNYVIHPAGTILRIYKHHTGEMKTHKRKVGYLQINLINNGIQKFFLVHRLVALHFIPNPDNKRCVDHINGTKDDNRLENLRWATHKENMNAFRLNPAAIITKGYIHKRKYSWVWAYNMKGKRKSKSMKNREDLEKYREETIKNIMLLYYTLNEIG